MDKAEAARTEIVEEAEAAPSSSTSGGPGPPFPPPASRMGHPVEHRARRKKTLIASKASDPAIANRLGREDLLTVHDPDTTKLVHCERCERDDFMPPALHSPQPAPLPAPGAVGGLEDGGGGVDRAQGHRPHQVQRRVRRVHGGRGPGPRPLRLRHHRLRLGGAPSGPPPPPVPRPLRPPPAPNAPRLERGGRRGDGARAGLFGKVEE